MPDQGGPGAYMEESNSDYQLRELEARMDRRLEVLEFQRDRMRRMARLAGAGFVVAVIALAIVVGTTFGGARSVEARSLSTEELVLRGADGTTRGLLAADADGRVQFSLSDREGRGRIRLTVLPDGSPGLTISDDEGRPRAVLGFLPDGTTSLVFADAQGTSRAVVGVEPDGSTHALFSDRGGRIRTLVGVGSDGAPSLSVVDADRAVVADTP
jgi:hypothetical protein